MNAALYRALGVIPGVQVKPHVTDIAGRAGIAFVLPKTPQSRLRHERAGWPPRDLLDRLNAYRTGCVDVTGYCNAVGVFASTLIGYDNVDTTPFVWYFSLAYVPGVTVKRITDAAGRADVEFRFPFSGGVTGILLDARTYGFAGYVKDGAQTLLLRQVDVSGPGVRP